MEGKAMQGLNIILPTHEELHNKRFGQFLIDAISDRILYDNNPLDEAHIVNAIRYMSDDDLIDTIHQYHALLASHELKGFAHRGNLSANT